MSVLLHHVAASPEPNTHTLLRIRLDALDAADDEMSRAPVYSFPPTPQDWSQIQEVVRSYYVNQKMPLKEVRAVLRDLHGFRAT